MPNFLEGFRTGAQVYSQGVQDAASQVQSYAQLSRIGPALQQIELESQRMRQQIEQSDMLFPLQKAELTQRLEAMRFEKETALKKREDEIKASNDWQIFEHGISQVESSLNAAYSGKEPPSLDLSPATAAITPEMQRVYGAQIGYRLRNVIDNFSRIHDDWYQMQRYNTNTFTRPTADMQNQEALEKLKIKLDDAVARGDEEEAQWIRLLQSTYVPSVIRIPGDIEKARVDLLGRINARQKSINTGMMSDADAQKVLAKYDEAFIQIRNAKTIQEMEDVIRGLSQTEQPTIKTPQPTQSTSKILRVMPDGSLRYIK